MAAPAPNPRSDMLTAKQMRTLNRAIADLGRSDLAELMTRIRTLRDAQFRDHIREVTYRMEEARLLRRARIAEIRAEVREFQEEWRRQQRRIAEAKAG